MQLIDYIVIGIILIIISFAVLYIVKAKKSGQKCVGCPYSKTCNSNKNESKCNCNSEQK